MSHRTKKTEEKKTQRTDFCGLCSKSRRYKKGKLRKAERKHKKAYLPF